MATVIYNVGGTSSPSFVIGKKGVTIYQGPTDPLSTTGNNGDVFIGNGTNPKIMNKVNGQWVNIISKNITPVSSNTTISLVNPEEYLLVDTTSNAVSLTLSTASLIDGFMVTIKDKGGNSATNNITISTEGTETIDGQSSIALATNYGSLSLLSDGANWYIV